MKQTTFLCITICLLFHLRITRAEGSLSFDRQIQPILSDKCFHCHGPDENNRKANLRLDTFEGATELRDGAAAIIPGEPENSPLIDRIYSTDPDEVMPTPKSHLTLTKEEKQLLKQWVQSGAQYQKHWAFDLVKKPIVPDGHHPIDYFIKAKIKSASNLTQNPPAKPHALSRRLSLDLTGLPISQKQAKHFERIYQNSPHQAVEHLVTELLASPHYGERMAWDWLDVSRYADTNGYQGDNERTMWPWRDWVIEAFQKNLSWDQFTVWQLAGDLIENPTHEQILATGFNRNHPINGEGGRIAEENRVEYVFDMTETMGTTWLGLTLECSRCHDHKFDPISQKDYFALNAYFNQTPVSGGDKSGQSAPVLKIPSPEQIARQTELNKKSQTLQQKAELIPLQHRHILKPTQATATHQKLLLRKDDTILATGPNPKNDTYHITYQIPPGVNTIGSIRLDALSHASHTPLPQGLARSDSGNFVLTEFEVTIDDERVSFKSAVASYEQGGLKIGRSYDGNSGTGWAVHRGKPVSNPEYAIFYLAEPITIQSGQSIKVVMRHDSRHPHHNMGRFRLSINHDNTVKKEATINSKPDLKKITDQLKKLNGAIPKVMVMEDQAKPRDTYILAGGLYNQRGETVTAAIPTIFGEVNSTSNRLDLANWLVDPQNPLTARVTVNRFWQLFFGTGLVKTSEDFGVQGERPTHPELLDWLAADFVESGWDVQHLIRLIVTSQTYQQSSNVTPNHLNIDPDNRLLARSPRHRLPAWMIRDQALAASQLLVHTIGGATVKPYQPDGIWAEVTFGKKKYTRDTGDKLYRRTIYTFWRRISRPPMLFDNANRLVCDVVPSRTNTPLQALTTMNDITYLEAARVASQNHPSIQQLFQSITNRQPRPDELAILKQRLKTLTTYYQKHPDQAAQLLSVGEYPHPQKANLPSLAARTAVTNLIYNLDEALCRP